MAQNTVTCDNDLISSPQQPLRKSHQILNMNSSASSSTCYHDLSGRKAWPTHSPVKGEIRFQPRRICCTLKEVHSKSSQMTKNRLAASNAAADVFSPFFQSCQIRLSSELSVVFYPPKTIESLSEEYLPHSRSEGTQPIAV
jgi:hypothetical protein